MAPQFTASAYVIIEDVEKLISVCNTLRKIGYTLGQHNTDSLDDFIITYPQINSTYCTGSYGYYDDLDKKGAIDCKTDINLFLEIAQMRSDTDECQWFTDGIRMYKCEYFDMASVYCYGDSPFTYNPRRATPNEVYEHIAKK